MISRILHTWLKGSRKSTLVTDLILQSILAVTRYLQHLLTYSPRHSIYLNAMVAAGSSFCYLLQDFCLGNSKTGKGGRLNDTAVAQLATACPNLIHASLNSSKHLTDASFLAFFINCPNLCYLSITGNDRVSGELKGPALDELQEKPDLGKKLEKMCFTDQNVIDKKLEKAIRSLSAARKNLVIEVGNTHERSRYITTWLGGKEKTGYQAFGGPGGFSQFGGW